MNPNIYIHELDRAALQTLKAIPGFSQLMKAFINFGIEKKAYIANMSSNIRLSEVQLPQYYNMLPPICEKLGIDVPELYLKLDPIPNAWTSGETKPYIIITTGLLETIPFELIPTVLAHECGHIACHHLLYTMMADLLLSNAINMLNLPDAAIIPLQAAFAYWERCSEMSADRAAMICDGNADNMIKVCTYFAGYDKDIVGDINIEAFLEQAIEYKNLVKNSAVNKIWEFYQFGYNTHPLTAVRALECDDWAKSGDLNRVLEYMQKGSSEIPMPETEGSYIGKNVQEVEDALRQIGFINIELVRHTEKSLFNKVGQVINIKIGEVDDLKVGNWYSNDDTVQIEYYEPYSEEEIAAMHPDEIMMPESFKKYLGKPYQQICDELSQAGFENIVIERQLEVKKSWGIKEGAISRITIDELPVCEKGQWCAKNALIKIIYHTFVENDQ